MSISVEFAYALNIMVAITYASFKEHKHLPMDMYMKEKTDYICK